MVTMVVIYGYHLWYIYSHRWLPCVLFMVNMVMLNGDVLWFLVMVIMVMIYGYHG